MIQHQRDALGRLIANTALYYGKQITRDVVSMMVDDLEDLPFEKIADAYQAIRKDPKNKFFPLPAQIREIISPTVSPEAEGREAVERIKTAITKFGHADLLGAKEFIGPIGWSIVQGNGGWVAVCESDFTTNPGLLAQARNRAEDLVRYKDQFAANVISLPTPKIEVQQIEERKFQALERFKEHQAHKESEVNFDIPSDEDRARMIQELLSKKKPVEL